jgi:hypothetical protein
LSDAPHSSDIYPNDIRSFPVNLQHHIDIATSRQHARQFDIELIQPDKARRFPGIYGVTVM